MRKHRCVPARGRRAEQTDRWTVGLSSGRRMEFISSCVAGVHVHCLGQDRWTLRAHCSLAGAQTGSRGATRRGHQTQLWREGFWLLPWVQVAERPRTRRGAMVCFWKLPQKVTTCTLAGGSEAACPPASGWLPLRAGEAVPHGTVRTPHSAVHSCPESVVCPLPL